MKHDGFRKIDDWYINAGGGLDINYPADIENVPGVIAITITIIEKDKPKPMPMLFSATSHYGPRIGDFKHSLTGNTQNARIHKKILDALRANKIVSLWVKNTPSPFIEKRQLIKKYDPPWNL